MPLLRLTPPAGPGGFRFYIKSKCVDSGRPGLEDLDNLNVLIPGGWAWRI